MSSIFTGQSALRHQFSELVFGNLSSATTAATAVLLHKFNHAGKLAFIDNTFNQTATLLLVHPEADSTVTANRLFWIKIPSNRVVNYTMLSSSLEFDPGTRMYVYCAVAPSSGAIDIATWG